MPATIDACCIIGPGGAEESSADDLLRSMDQVGVDRAMVHPPDRCYAWDNQEGNELTAAAAAGHGDRLIATVTANPWRRDAWDVIRRGLDAGARALSFSPGVQGFVLGEDKLWGVLEKLTDFNARVPVYVHTGHHSHATPCQLFLLARRVPQLRFIMGHSGSTDFAVDVAPVMSVSENIYVESSFARPWGFVRRLEKIGHERAMMGSGFPQNGMEFEWSEMRRQLRSAHAAWVLGECLAALLGDRT